MNKNYIIELPKGLVIDTEKSTDTKIVVKAVVEEKTECKTYEEIQGYNIMNRKEQFYVTPIGCINSCHLRPLTPIHTTIGHTPSEKIAEKIIALCQLYIIAEYYNDGWVPDWNDNNEKRLFALYNPKEDIVEFRSSWYPKYGTPVFKSMEAIEEAYKHNKEIFKKALSV